MPRNRFILATLVFVLVAAACGGDDSDLADQTADARPETFTTSDSGSGDSSEADPDGTQQDAAAPDTASDAEPLDSTSGTEPQDSSQPETFSQPVVLLGDRFAWCADVEAVWTNHEQTVANFLASEAEYEEVLAAYESAADELDRAEIRETLNEAERSYNESHDKFLQVLTGAAFRLRQARGTYGDRPEDIAAQRAWAALLSADPELAALSAAVPDDPDPRVPVPTDLRLTPSDILEQAIGTPSTRRKPAAQEAAYEVYSQVDHTRIAEVLLDVAPQAAQAAAQAEAQARLYGKTYGESRADITRAANYIFQVSSSWILSPYDVAAFEAALAAAPNASLGLIDSPEAYARSITYWLEDWDELAEAGEIAQSAFWSRWSTVEDALPIALEAAREAEALLEVEARAEAARQREAEQALQAALEELATGSDAYTAFKRSFEKSCQ